MGRANLHPSRPPHSTVRSYYQRNGQADFYAAREAITNAYAVASPDLLTSLQVVQSFCFLFDISL